MFSSKRALERSKMRPPKLMSRVADVHECTPMTLDFGDDDVADLASSQNTLMYSGMIDQGVSLQDIISEDEQQWQHVSVTLQTLHTHSTMVSCLITLYKCKWSITMTYNNFVNVEFLDYFDLSQCMWK
jgi:hypothetical protein